MNYYQPGTLAEATALLRDEADAKVIAGGQSMMPLLRQDLVRPGALVDISRVDELTPEVRIDDDTVSVGAMVTYQELLEHDVCSELHLLRDSIEAIGDVPVRNAGTIGGGAAHGDPAQDLPPALQCYGTDLVVTDGETERTLDVTEFYIDFYFTELRPDEILTRVDIARPPEGSGGAFAKHARTPGGFSEAGVAVLAIPDDDGGYDEIRLAYCAGAPVPRRVPEAVEAALVDGPVTESALETAADGLVESLDNVGDVGDYDEAYNEHIFRVLTRRAVTTALERSSGPELAP